MIRILLIWIRSGGLITRVLTILVYYLICLNTSVASGSRVFVLGFTMTVFIFTICFLVLLTLGVSKELAAHKFSKQTTFSAYYWHSNAVKQIVGLVSARVLCLWHGFPSMYVCLKKLYGCQLWRNNNISFYNIACISCVMSYYSKEQ